MRIGIAITSSGKRLNIDADPTMLGDEIIEQLLNANVILPAPDGQTYVLAFKDRNEHAQLDMGNTLQANGVEENDVLALSYGGIAGA